MIAPSARDQQRGRKPQALRQRPERREEEREPVEAFAHEHGAAQRAIVPAAPASRYVDRVEAHVSGLQAAAEHALG